MTKTAENSAKPPVDQSDSMPLLAASLTKIADGIEEVAAELDSTGTTDGSIFYTRKAIRAVQTAIREEALRLTCG